MSIVVDPTFQDVSVDETAYNTSAPVAGQNELVSTYNTHCNILR